MISQKNPDTLKDKLDAGEIGDVMRELGWNHPPETIGSLQVNLGGRKTAELNPVAEQGEGQIIVWTCSGSDGRIPDIEVRKHLVKRAREECGDSIVVFHDAEWTDQKWEMMVWTGKRWRRGSKRWTRDGHHQEDLLAVLYESYFDWDDETAKAGFAEEKVKNAFLQDQVTKRFYREVRGRLGGIESKIQGLSQPGKKRFAKVLLNRIMFIYFLQGRGLMGKDRGRWLQKRLQECDNQGKEYYKDVLKPLFAEVLDTPKNQRVGRAKTEMSDLPYLNGGLFTEHEDERTTPIRIPNAAWKELYEVLDRYQWRCDTRYRKSEQEIDPEILGYVFEQLVNEETGGKKSGVYYTKDDVTHYMSTRTLIPGILERARKLNKTSFGRGNSEIWRQIAQDPDRYIYQSMLHGLDLVEQGEKPEVERDGGFGEETCYYADRWALPGERRIETEHRWQRVRDLRKILENKSEGDLNALVTLNLNVERVMEDWIRESGDESRLLGLWEGVEAERVLDPTCGSGAFLLVAASVLEAIYAAIIEQADTLVEEDDYLVDSGKRKHRRCKRLREKLEEVKSQPSPAYWIVKTVIVYNLYGVDLMESAVEIAKLRLYLKLAATWPIGSSTMPPLPDVDFNLRYGNMLTGLWTSDELDVDQGRQSAMVLDDRKQTVEKILEDLAIAHAQYALIQRQGNPSKEAKENLKNKEAEIESRIRECDAKKAGADAQSLHWVVAFYAVMRDGGFTSVIGNPPYLSRKDMKNIEYSIRNAKIETEKEPNVYAWCLERAGDLTRPHGRMAMIVMLNLTFGKDYARSREILAERNREFWISSYSKRPDQLFEATTNVEVRNTIVLTEKGEGGKSWTTRLHRWKPEQRGALFEGIEYARFDTNVWNGKFPKVGPQALLWVLENAIKSYSRQVIKAKEDNLGRYPLKWKKVGGYFLQYLDQLEAGGVSGGLVRFRYKKERDAAMWLGNGKLGFVWWLITGDDFNVTRSALESFPLKFGEMNSDQLAWFRKNKKRLEQAMESGEVYFTAPGGKRVRGYSLRKKREVTDDGDKRFLDALSASEEARQELELLYVQSMHGKI